MAFDRNRFQAAKLDVNKKVTDEVEKTFQKQSGRGDYHSITDGANYFRMMPPHDPNEPSMQAKVVYWLDCKVEEVDQDGKPTGKTIVKSRPIFDSRIHGGTPKDIIFEYINYTKKKIFATIQDKDEKSKKLAPIQGWRDKAGKWNPGILPNQSFVCYATKGDIKPENLGRLELWARDKETLEKLNISEKSDEPIITDNFSDPNDGVRFIITKGKDSKGSYYTLITKDNFEATGVRDIEKAWKEWKSSQVVPDDVLIKLSEMEPLSKQFKNAYKRNDFERAVEALEMFDIKHNFGTFQDQEFRDIILEIDGYYSVESNTSSPVDETKSAIENTLTLEEMNRDQLKQYIKEKGYGFKVVNSMSDDVIRETIYEIEMNPDGTETEMESDITEETKKEEVPFESNVNESLKDRLARLKAQK